MTSEVDALWMHSREIWLRVNWPDGNVLAANHRAVELCGRFAEQIVGVPW